MNAKSVQPRFSLLQVLILAGSVCLAGGAQESRDDWQQPQRVVADLGLRPGATVADIGCGQGYFTFRVAAIVGNKGTVYATEISTRALQVVAGRVRRENLTNIKPVVSEPTDTKLRSGSLDAALLVMVIHEVPKDQRLALVKDIARALRPGGFLLLIDWRVDATIEHDRDQRIPKDDLLRLATNGGLTLDAEFHYLRHQVFLRFRKPTQ